MAEIPVAISLVVELELVELERVALAVELVVELVVMELEVVLRNVLM